MEIVKRRYRLLSDFSQVHGFLADIYTLDTLNSYLLPPFFEYTNMSFSTLLKYKVKAGSSNKNPPINVIADSSLSLYSAIAFRLRDASSE
jgi:hypothetical protein